MSTLITLALLPLTLAIPKDLQHTPQTQTWRSHCCLSVHQLQSSRADMARACSIFVPLLVGVCCVVANAYPTTTPPLKTLTPLQHKAAGKTVVHLSWITGRKVSQGMSNTKTHSRWKRQLTPASQHVPHTRVLSRWKRQEIDDSNWLKRLYHQKRRVLKKFFSSSSWGKYRRDAAVSSVFMFVSTTLDVYMQSLGLGEVGSISTYMDLLWLSYDILKELTRLADLSCFYPIYWPLYKLAPDHCNPFKELQYLLDHADELEELDEQSDHDDRSDHDEHGDHDERSDQDERNDHDEQGDHDEEGDHAGESEVQHGEGHSH